MKGQGLGFITEGFGDLGDDFQAFSLEKGFVELGEEEFLRAVGEGFHVTAGADEV